MKNGKTPIHIQRWAPVDYHEDEHVKLLKARRDYATLTFYRHFLDFSFIAGGDLPADPEALAAAVEMPQADVERALEFCLGRLIEQSGKRLYQKRVRRDVASELQFRDEQSERGKRGGRPTKASGSGGGKPPLSRKKATAFQNTAASKSPPAPAPAPAPSNELPPQAPPADAGGGLRVPRDATARRKRKDRIRNDADELERYAIRLGGRVEAPWRAQIRESLRAGYPLEQVRGSVAELVRSDLIRAGRISEADLWPPAPPEIPPGSPAAATECEAP